MEGQAVAPICDCTPEGDVARGRPLPLHQEHCALQRSRTKAAPDPTTQSIEGGNAERDRLRVEVLRLSEALVAAYTDSEAVSVERDHLRVEADRLKKIGETMFVEGYAQAVCEIRDHFRKADAEIVAKEIEKIWLQDKLS